MNSPNYPPPGGQPPYGGPPQGQPYGQRPPQTPPGGQQYGGQPPQTPPGGQQYGGQPPQTPPGGQQYGGQPPQGQPFGGPPPQGQPFTGPGGPGGPGGPASGANPASSTPPPKKKNTGKIIKVALAVVVIGIAAVVYFVTRESAPASSKVGDCIKVNSASVTNADVERVECTNPDAAYKVAATFDDAGAKCPDHDKSNYVSYTETGRGSDLLLCLTLNAKEGDCFIQGNADKKVACTDPKASFMVTKILTGTTDPTGCPEGTEDGYLYKEPAMVQCFGPPTGQPAGT